MKIGAVIAASYIPVSGERFEQMLESDSLLMTERIILNFQRSGIKDIVVVTGERAEQLERRLQHRGVIFLRDEEYQISEMEDTMQIGVDYLSGFCDRIFICPMDVPFFRRETVQYLLEKTGNMLVPVYHGIAGYPICMDASLRYSPSAEGPNPIYVEVQDAGIVEDKAVWETYEQQAEVYDEKLIRPGIKVRLVKHKPFFGPGIVTILKQIERLGSVREACTKTGISYSKGWTLIRTAEEELGYKIVERMPGGKHGGEAYVTEKGQKLLRLYKVYAERVEAAAEEMYEEIFLKSDLF